MTALASTLDTSFGPVTGNTEITWAGRGDRVELQPTRRRPKPVPTSSIAKIETSRPRHDEQLQITNPEATSILSELRIRKCW
jgi:hypothetical protein